MSKNILFISDQTLLSRTQVHGNIDPQLLFPEIKAAQDMFILPLIGTALFDKIAAGILANNLAGKYLELKDDYIIDTLIWYVLSELPMGLSFQFWNKGVLRQGSETAETPSMTDLVSLADRYKRRAEWYAERLKRYLIENAAVSFPEYLNPGNGVDTVQPHASSFTMPIYLGGGAYGKENNGGHPREYLTNCQL